MKKIILLLFAITNLINCMEKSAAAPTAFEFWQELPQEVQSHILSFVPETTCFNSYTKAQTVNSQFHALLTDQAFLNNYAERLAQYNMPLAEQVLLQASTEGSVLLATALLKAGVNPDCCGVSPFDSNFLASLPDELKKKYNLDQLAPNGKNESDTPLLNALENNQIAVAELLISHSATVNRFIGKSPLLTVVAARGDVAGVSLLLDHDAHINEQESDGETALWWAVWNNQPTAQLLVEREANLDLVGGDIGASPMMIAANRGDYALVQLMLSKGADVNLVDMNDTTTLEYALLNKHKETAQLLTEQGGVIYNEIVDDEPEED
jgi:hypothetical protein